jgi:hypothetical protein
MMFDREQPERAFQPFTLMVLIETERELLELINVVGLNISIPNAVRERVGADAADTAFEFLNGVRAQLNCVEGQLGEGNRNTSTETCYLK